MSTAYYVDVATIPYERQLCVGVHSATGEGGTWAWNVDHLAWGNLAGQHQIDDSIRFRDEYRRPVTWRELYELIVRSRETTAEFVGRLS